MNIPDSQRRIVSTFLWIRLNFDAIENEIDEFLQFNWNNHLLHILKAVYNL